MSQPKHLWSGDWEYESQPPPAAPEPPSGASALATDTLPATDTALVTDPAADAPQPAVELLPLIPVKWERIAMMTVVALVVVAAGVWAFSSLTSSSDRAKNQTGYGLYPAAQNSGLAGNTGGFGNTGAAGNTGGSGNTGQPSYATSGAAALGMNLTVAGNEVLVQSVNPNSPASSVFISPGEDLLSINGQAVTSPAQANALIDKLPLGTSVTIQLAQDGAQITAQIQEPGVP